MKPIIQVEGLGKRYVIGEESASYRTLRDALAQSLQSLGRRKEPASIWALRDVSFEVQPGEVLGIIGRNGAGKSTLLKLLSRITEPTEGSINIYGRLASLLEVGTGFHPELTGRENIFLNGAILGMKRVEVARRFDEIVEFAEVEKFLNTPVKRYSSGMYMRLAFAVAAHLNPEILIVDEVLAVGDAQFQKKCLGKMGDISSQGRTVLLVSHNMGAIQSFCQRVLLLEGGRLVSVTDTEAALNFYLKSGAAITDGFQDLKGHPNRVTSPETAVFQSLRLLDAKNRQSATFESGQGIDFEFELDLGTREYSNPLIALAVEKQGVRICTLTTYHMSSVPIPLAGRQTLRCHWDFGWLAPGVYNVSRIEIRKFMGGDKLDTIEEPISFEITALDSSGTGRDTNGKAIVLPKGQWTRQEGTTTNLQRKREPQIAQNAENSRLETNENQPVPAAAEQGEM